MAKQRGRPSGQPGNILSVFLNKFKEAVMAPKSDEFADDIFIHFTNSPKNGYGNYVPPYKASKRTLGEFMAGHEPGPDFLRDVMKHKDISYFASWLQTEYEDSWYPLVLICNEYEKGATKDNFGQHIAGILSRIIDTMRLGSSASVVLDHDPIAGNETVSSNYKLKYADQLLSESGFHCEICRASLLGASGNLDYFVMPFFKGDTNAPIDQLVPVCREDFYILEQKPEKERTEALRKAKFLFSSEQQLKKIAMMTDLDERLGDLIEELNKTGFTDPTLITEEVKIRMNPVEVDKKVGDEPELSAVVKSLVTLDYDRVFKACNALAQRPEYHDLSEKMSDAMRHAYTKLKSISTESKFVIFIKMVEAIHERTKKEMALCMSLLSFYIQDCDFFDVITE